MGIYLPIVVRVSCKLVIGRNRSNCMSILLCRFCMANEIKILSIVDAVDPVDERS